MDKAFKRHAIGVGEFLSGIAESEQTPNSDDICAAGFEVFERAPHSRASIDHIIHNCDACPLDSVAERVGNAIACREKAIFTGFGEALRIREGYIQFRRYDQCDKSSLYERAADRV